VSEFLLPAFILKTLPATPPSNQNVPAYQNIPGDWLIQYKTSLVYFVPFWF